MGTITVAFNLAFDDFNTSGVPASGNKKPKKNEIRDIGPTIENRIEALENSAANAAVTVRPRGPWNALTADYVVNDSVEFLGTQWRALRAVAAGVVPNLINTLDWEIFVQGYSPDNPILDSITTGFVMSAHTNIFGDIFSHVIKDNEGRTLATWTWDGMAGMRFDRRSVADMGSKLAIPLSELRSWNGGFDGQRNPLGGIDWTFNTPFGASVRAYQPPASAGAGDATWVVSSSNADLFMGSGQSKVMGAGPQLLFDEATFEHIVLMRLDSGSQNFHVQSGASQYVSDTIGGQFARLRYPFVNQDPITATAWADSALQIKRGKTPNGSWVQTCGEGGKPLTVLGLAGGYGQVSAGDGLTHWNAYNVERSARDICTIGALIYGRLFDPWLIWNHGEAGSDFGVFTNYETGATTVISELAQILYDECKAIAGNEGVRKTYVILEQCCAQALGAQSSPTGVEQEQVDMCRKHIELTATTSAAVGNVGNGTFAATPVVNGYIRRGRYELEIIVFDTGLFEITGPTGVVVSRGNVGVAHDYGGFEFTLNAGGTAFANGDTLYIDVDNQTTMDFDMSFITQYGKFVDANIHPDQYTINMVSEYRALVIEFMRETGAPMPFFYMKSALDDGTDIVITLNNPFDVPGTYGTDPRDGPLPEFSLDYFDEAPWPVHGFSIKDATNAPVLSNVRIIDHKTIKIARTVAATGASRKIAYGLGPAQLGTDWPGCGGDVVLPTQSASWFFHWLGERYQLRAPMPSMTVIPLARHAVPIA